MTLTRRTFLTLAGAGALAWAGPLRAREAATLAGTAFGSSFRLTLSDGSRAREAEARIVSIVSEIDGLMSPWRAGSELSRFNALASTDAVPVSAPTRAVLAKGLAIARASGGAFDPTVGPIVGRYGFGPIASGARGHFGQLELTDEGVRKQVPGLSIDLCGIAKGHALDRIAAALDDLGAADYLLELGGEVFSRGTHPAGRDWRVGVERPGPGGGVAHLLAPGGRAVATSGDAANFYEIAGRRYTHVIDPLVGEPVTGDLASVSVLAENGTEADGWATALVAAGLERGFALAEAQGLDALFLVRDGEGFKTMLAGRAEAHLLS